MLHELFMELLRTWFHWVEVGGYWGVFFLMAMESSIIPVPSEVVMPPAAFWAAQGRMDFWGVVIAGTAGSYFGSILNYYLARTLGKPIVYRYGKYFLLGPDKLAFAETWVSKYGPFGIFVSRLLPVVRHLISIPAGIFKMPVVPFSIVTTVGAGLWCFLLSWFGSEVIGSSPEILQSPQALVAVVRAKFIWFFAAIAAFCVLYACVVYLKKRNQKAALGIF